MSSNTSQRDMVAEIGWMILVIIMIALAIIFGAPVIILAFIAQRLFKNYLATRWRVFVWLGVAILPTWIFYTTMWTHGLDVQLAKAGQDYFAAFWRYQANISHWPWPHLWGETWPLWIRSLLLFPLLGLFMECFDKTRDVISAHALAKKLNKEQARNIRYQRSAQKKAGKSQRIPHVAGGMMVMGIPIKRKKQP